MPGDEDEQPNIQDFILARELAEVYLLLDNISTARNKTIPVVTDDPLFAGTDKTWIEQVCDIAWPPDDETKIREGLKAAKLLHAKDLLNVEAAPATGASIAFTLMMSGEARDPSPRSSWWRRSLMWLADGTPPPGSGLPVRGGPPPGGNPPTRASLAAQAYPSLSQRAWRYRVALVSLVVFLVVWLFLTCFLSWDVATGTSLLNRVNDLDAQITVASKSAAVAPPQPSAPAAPAKAAPPAAAPAASAPAGSAQNDAKPAGQAAAGDKGPDANSRNVALFKVASGNLKRWLEQHEAIRARLIGEMGGQGETADIDPGLPTNGSGTNTEWAAVCVGVLAGTILPIFYGLLGAGAAVVRIVSARMRDSTLMPRDIYLAYIQLALGAVIGACVGLFVTSSGNTTPTAGGLLGAVPLSASALCFVAGFGVEGVFQALESLVKRVFNLDPAKTG